MPTMAAAADRDRVRGLNLLTADSTTNSSSFFSNDDQKPLVSYFVCCVEAVERMARESGFFILFDLRLRRAHESGVFILFDLQLRRGHNSIFVGNDNDDKLAAPHGWYSNR